MEEDSKYSTHIRTSSSKEILEKSEPKRKMIILETRRQFPKGYDNKTDKREASSSPDSSDTPRLFQQNNRRKETARRQLLGSIYTKHKTVGRSFSFVAGERPPVQVRFPRVHCKDKTADENPNADRIPTKPHIPQTKRRHSKMSDNATTSGVSNARSRPVHRTNSQKLSLPDIIMDFNAEVNMVANDRARGVIMQDTESENDERGIGASYEEYLKPRLSVNSPYKAKHRPVTPGLLESLNKLRLPSKVKTEQWLKSSQSVQKSYCVGSYKVGNLHNTNLAYPNWIYTDS